MLPRNAVMQITKVEIRLMRNEGNLKAFCSVIFDECFIVHGLKVIEHKEGLFVAMPSREISAGEFRDIAHPMNSDFHHKLQNAILEAYRKTIGATGPQGS